MSSTILDDGIQRRNKTLSQLSRGIEKEVGQIILYTHTHIHICAYIELYMILVFKVVTAFAIFRAKKL